MFKKLQQLFLAGFSSLIFLPDASATIHTITVSNNNFTPAAITNAVVGDTIKWNWAASGHDVATTSLPVGAITISTGIQNSGFTFEYKILVAGTYTYKCTPHASMGMIGGFTASPLTSVKDVTNKPFSMSVSPAGNTFTILGSKSPIAVDLFDVSGRKINSYKSGNAQNASFDISMLTPGMYILSIYSDGKQYSEKLVVTR